MAKRNTELAYLKSNIELLTTYRKGSKEIVSRKSYRILLEGAREAALLTDNLISAHSFIGYATDLGMRGKLASRFYQLACDKNQSLFTVLVMARRHYTPEDVQRMRSAVAYTGYKGMSRVAADYILPKAWVNTTVGAMGTSYPKVQKVPALQVLAGPSS